MARVRPQWKKPRKRISKGVQRAAAAFARVLFRNNVEITTPRVSWLGTAPAVGVAYHPSWGQNKIARKLAARTARRNGVHAVLFLGKEPGVYVVYFVPDPADLVGDRSQGALTVSPYQGATASSAIGGAEAAVARYILAGIAGAAAGEYVGGRRHRMQGALAGGLCGALLAFLTEPGPPPTTTTITDESDIARDSLLMLEGGQVGRLISIGIWGPATYWAATESEHPLLAVALGIGGVAMIAGAATMYQKTRDLRARFEAAATRHPIVISHKDQPPLHTFGAPPA